MSQFHKTLISALKDGTLLPLVGAGVSMSIKDTEGKRVFPSWPELLNNAAIQVGDSLEPLIKGLVTANELHTAADLAKKNLPASEWFKFIESQFNIELLACDKNSFALPKAIWKLSSQIITLNYDKVMEFCSDSSKTQIIKNYLLAGINKMQSVSDDKMIWHLHGHVDEPDKLVLTPDGYNRLYDDNTEYLAALKALKTVLATRSLIFIGCSLNDVELLAELAAQHDLFEGNTQLHFAFVHENEKDVIKERLKNFPSIILIPFSDFGQPFVDLINELAVHKNTALNEPDTDEEITVQAANQPNDDLIRQEPKIAYLSANPLGTYCDFIALDNKLERRLPYDLHSFPLTEASLQDLTGYDYLVFACRIKNNKLLIENEWLGREPLTIEELEANLELDDLKGVIVICDKNPAMDALENITLPILFIPELDMPDNCLDKLWFQLFKKQSFTTFESTCLLHNISKFDLGIPVKQFKGKKQAVIQELPKEISKEEIKKFIGRKQDLEDCSRALYDASIYKECLTIQGTGGLGKTTLVKKLAFEYSQRQNFGQSITFIDCENLGNYQQFHRFIAGAFELEDAIDFIAHIEKNKDLQEGDRLIIIDNAESLLQLTEKDKICRLIGSTLEYATIIVTSREPLNITSEKIFMLRDFVTDEALVLFEEKSNRNFTEREREYLRQHILKELLDNNPLAISLVASSLVKGKSLEALKSELEDNFFELTKIQQASFTNPEERNIDRKSSIYNSIDYSYRALHETQKDALIKLSYFPDGIDLENFKKLTENDTEARGKAAIKDATIKVLQDKSLVQTNNKHIRLHPLVVRFARGVVRNEEEVTYLKIVFDYNAALASSLNQLGRSGDVKKRAKADMIFDAQLRNILTSVENINENYDDHTVAYFLNLVSLLVFKVGAYSEFRDALSRISSIFNRSKKLNLYIKILLLTLRYFSGDFNRALYELKELLSIDDWCAFNVSDDIEYGCWNTASAIYLNEGYEMETILNHFDKKNKMSSWYNPQLSHLGVFDADYAGSALQDESSIDVKLALGQLSIKEFNAAFEHIHPKNHLSIANFLFIKSKLVPLNITEIDSLVVVNPYTQGIKYLLYAGHCDDIEQSKKFFELSLPELIHIKFSYVEALYLYAKWLKKNNLPSFDEINQEGVMLSKEFHYRYLQHSFLQLTCEVESVYNEADYPLPDGIDFSGHIQNYIKYCKREIKN
ncbi:SIR2 family protein [Moritella sp.]|uniref:SIR2 family protein n=1 Tax=Moritella sp. TaxID=78556 RepID=UPI001DFE2902|nr:SIR2 family protein [Moritella sp.]MCJ8350127.1 SIR2 family protein [Moritella sp.]NQZ40932.1 SIR2 family protein [Moritella sp.]